MANFPTLAANDGEAETHDGLADRDRFGDRTGFHGLVRGPKADVPAS
jgi:hypothetical protein